MRAFVVLMVIVCGNLSPLALYAGPKPVVVESYIGSPNLPDWASYAIFLAQSKAFIDHPEHGDSYFAEVLGVDHQTPEGATIIAFYKSWFTASSLEVQREASSEELRILCSGDWSSMTADEYAKGQQELEAHREKLYRDHLEATLEQMHASVRTAFLNFLQERKKYITHSKVDMSEVYKSQSEGELRQAHANSCKSARSSGDQ